MLVSEVIKLLKDFPEDYRLVISDYTTIVIPANEESDAENFIVISDDPITGIIENEDTREISFCSERSKSILQSDESEFQLLQ